MILAFAGQKGGSGKSTTAIAVACELHRRGEKVLLVDADPQGSCRTFAATAAESGHEGPTVVGMIGADLATKLGPLTKSFDHTIIDCPPRHAETQRAALVATDIVTLPCGPAAMDAWALAESLEQIKLAKLVSRPGRQELFAAVIITRKTRTAIGASAREALGGCGLPVLKSELGFRTAFQEAPGAGLGVTAYAPTSLAAGETHALTDELISVAKKLGKKHA